MKYLLFHGIVSHPIVIIADHEAMISTIKVRCASIPEEAWRPSSAYLNAGITLSVMHLRVSITTSRGTDDVQLHSNIISSALKASVNI